jgi:hypothetical protein
MRPCTGVPGVSPPLCTWAQLQDGTYTAADVERFNVALDELTNAKAKAWQAKQ